MLKRFFKYYLWMLFITMIGVYIWCYFAFSFYIISGFTAVLIGFIMGVFTALNYDRENGVFYWMAAGISSLTAYYLGKYLIFGFYNGLIDIHADLNIASAVGLIFLKTSSTSLINFIQFHLNHYDFFDFLWPTATLIMALYHAQKVLVYKQYWHKIKKRFVA
ncbi:MAG: hypothetical protein ACJAUV_001518 [Flavobacteriales bacterium]|jgi:hypothetical protein